MTGTASKPPSLERARAILASVKRDPAKRRYRHNWEKAIRALTRAARGKDRPAALLEAARARYALYRFSAIEADREEALRLARRASLAGSREAKALAAAIRREAGDEPPADRSTARRLAVKAPSRSHPGSSPRRPRNALAAVAPAAVPVAIPIARPAAAAGEEEASDPALEKAVADLDEPAAATGTPEAGAGPGVAGPARVSEVKAWSNADYTRVAVYLSRSVGYEKQELAAVDDRPRRLALDLRPALLEGRVLAHPVGDAQVERVRAAQRDADTVRVVLDLAGSDAYQLFRLDDPPRLIVDVGTGEAQRDAQAALSTPGGPAREPSAGVQGPEAEEGGGFGRSIRRVVVDAGHGGHDTGAIGPHGIREKDVTLAMAKRLARRLEAAGFQVVLTRKDDRYLPLEERTAIANTARGDLFVSLHANAHPRRDRRGVETYFLNVSDDRYAARLAARENGLLSDEEAPDRQVTRILSDLDARASAGTSRRLAQLVQRELTGGIRARVGDVRDLGVKSAVFYVLLGARMPAVLVETSFISNRAEEKRLASRGFQEEVAGDVARAVQQFAGREARVAAAR